MTSFFHFPNNRKLFGMPVSGLAVIIWSTMEKVDNFFLVLRSLNQEEPYPDLRDYFWVMIKRCWTLSWMLTKHLYIPLHPIFTHPTRHSGQGHVASFTNSLWSNAFPPSLSICAVIMCPMLMCHHQLWQLWIMVVSHLPAISSLFHYMLGNFIHTIFHRELSL